MKVVHFLKYAFLVILSLGIFIASFYPAQEVILSIIDNRYVSDPDDITYYLMENDKGLVLDFKWNGRREFFTTADIIVVRRQPWQQVNDQPEKFTPGQKRVINYLNNLKGTPFENTPVAKRADGMVDSYFFSSKEYSRINIEIAPKDLKPQVFIVHLVDTRLNLPRGWVRQIM